MGTGPQRTDTTRSGDAVRPEAPCLEVSGLSKTYLQTRVLADAAMRIGRGEIHALLGANGSGKSTLVKCVTGVVPPDPGAAIAVDGAPPVGALSPGRAHALGIRVVHQEAPLVDGLAIADSIALHRGYPLRGRIFTSRRQMREQAAEILARLEVEIDPETPAGTLSAAQRAMVMLALALADVERGSRLIVLDEPTASLPAADADHFLAAVERAAAQGAGVMLVTHRLAEVSERCGRLTVLRDGRVVASGAVGEFSEERMLAEIVGPELPGAAGQRPAAIDSGVARFMPVAALAPRPGAQPMLEARGLAGEIVADASFTVAPGEILGISGIVGSGAEEIGRLIAGVVPLRGGSLSIDGEDAPTPFGVRIATACGIAYVPGDRLREGGIPGLSVADNMALPNLRRYLRNPGEAKAAFVEAIDVFKVNPPEPERPFGTLSGGNQQKVIIGKWALMRPRLFVLDDPTAGVDPGAREDIYAVLRGLQKAGTAILLISSEPEQLVRLARRVLVVKSGRVVEELAGDRVTVAAISRAAM
jgi:ABC-type sugar transport system ATPase subunit